MTTPRFRCGSGRRPFVRRFSSSLRDPHAVPRPSAPARSRLSPKGSLSVLRKRRLRSIAHIRCEPFAVVERVPPACGRQIFRSKLRLRRCFAGCWQNGMRFSSKIDRACRAPCCPEWVTPRRQEQLPPRLCAWLSLRLQALLLRQRPATRDECGPEAGCCPNGRYAVAANVFRARLSG